MVCQMGLCKTIPHVFSLNVFGNSLYGSPYLIYILCNPNINHKTPYELIFKEPPTFLHIKTFECLSYTFIITRHRDKLVPWANKCIILGYPSCLKRFILYNLYTRFTLISRNCILYEHNFPHTTPTTKPTTNINHTSLDHGTHNKICLTDFPIEINPVSQPQHNHSSISIQH